MRPVSIILPVGADIAAAIATIDSAIEFGELGSNILFVINDAGVAGDAVDSALNERYGSHPGIRLSRNDESIGFAASCNVAVYELDTTTNDVLLLSPSALLTAGALQELREVTISSEKHAVVAPRSNDSIVTAIPTSPRLPDREDALARASTVFSAIVESLPRFTIAPAVDYFCLYLRRLVIDNHGLFDAEFPSAQHAVTDFSLRVNRIGYSTVIANRAFVSHTPIAPPSIAVRRASAARRGKSEVKPLPKSIPGRLVPKEDDEAAQLGRKYPYLPLALRDFERFSRGAVDRFADLIVPEPGVKKRVLVDLYHMSLNYDGSSRYALSFLDYLRGHAATGEVDFYVSSSKEAIEFFKLDQFGFPTLADDDFVDVIFDVGIALCPATISANQLIRMNNFCLKWVISHLDVISLRSWELRAIAWSRRVSVRDSFRYAEKVITISDYSVTDAFDYYATEIDGYRTKFASVLMGHSAQPLSAKTSGLVRGDLPKDIQATLKGDYVFVLGNGFPHKQVQQTLDALADSDLKVVVMGSLVKGAYTTEAGHHSLPSGRLSEKLMRELYSGAKLIVFPSAYEGFGLPIAEAAYEGKRMVVFDTEVSREVVKVLEIDDVVTFFENFAELDPIIRIAMEEASAAGGDPEKRQVRDLSEYNAGVLDEVLLLARNSSVDVEQLNARWDHFVSLPQYDITAEAFDEDGETVGIPVPRDVAIVGLPSAVGLGSKTTVHINVEGAHRKPVAGRIRIMDGETVLARKTLVRGEASLPVTFEHPGKRLLSVILRDEDNSLVLRNVVVNVASPRPIVLKPLSGTVGAGDAVTFELAIKPDRRSEVGQFEVRDGDTLLARVPAKGGTASASFTARFPGERYLSVQYEAHTDEKLVWGRSVVPLSVQAR